VAAGYTPRKHACSDANVMPPRFSDPVIHDASSPATGLRSPTPLLADQVRLLFANSPNAQYINLAVAALVVVALLPHVPPGRLVAWIATMYVVVGYRLGLRELYVRRADALSHEAWLAWFRLGAAATGACWGAPWFLLPGNASPATELMVAMVLAGMVGAGVPILSAVFAAFRDFAVLALVPTALALLARGDRMHTIAGVMALLYLAGVLSSAHRFRGVLSQSLQLLSEQSELVRSLSAANTELRSMRDTLERRVDERTEALRLQLAERERAEAALRSNEDMFRLITDNVSDMIAVWDRNGSQLYGSRSLTRALGRRNITGSRPGFGEVHPQDLDRLRKALRNTFDTGQGCHTELRLMDDGIRVIDCAVEPVTTGGAEPDKVVVVARDVTQRRQEEAIVREARERLSLAIEATGQILFDVDCGTRSVYLDAHWSAWLGGPARETRATFDELLPLVPEEDHALMRTRYLATLRGDVPDYSMQHRIRMPDGTQRWIVSRAKVVERDERGRALRLIGTNVDITVQRLADQRLRLMGRAIDDMAEGVVILDADWRILWVNPAFCGITGYPSDQAVGKVSQVLRAAGTTDAGQGLVASVQARGHWEGRLTDRRKSGGTYPVWVSASAMREADGRIGSVVIVFTDISRQERDAERMRYLAFHDSLTDLPNRALFFQNAGDLIRRADRHERRLALLFVDLDRFKSVNDSLGHEAGDQVLVAVATRLRTALREFDVVARLGGDEFAILLDNIGEDDAALVSAKLLESLAAPIMVGEHALHVEASIGISRFPGDGATADLLLRQADAAMYLAKQEGRNRFRFFSPDITADVLQRLDIASDLKLAVEREQLVLHYQPAVDATDGHVLGVEALLRWQHPQRGLVAPNDFIHVAEETGSIDAIGRWVLETACRQLHAWQAMGLPRLTMKVNLSPLQFLQPTLLQEVKAAMESNQLEPGTLEIEITESTAMQEPERSERVLTEMRNIGIRVSLDDFGTGHSSLAQLSRFPIQGLKIDRTLVAALPGDRKNAVIASTVASLCRNLGLDLVGEGVELPSQAEFLLSQGCRQMQGFLFSRPVDAATVEPMLYRQQHDAWTVSTTLQ
jgi:diguanylate cyclase (GGDEF)-like protein/PAS domain S-box-containing protein